MSQDTQNLIGKILTGNVERDAIHIAVLPVEAGIPLIAGVRVGLLEGKAVPSGAGIECIGVVDPFLDRHVQRGERCLVFLTPGTVTGMRHHWEHPTIGAHPANLTKSEHEEWIREFAEANRFDYKELLSAAIAGNDDYVIAHGRDLHGAHQLEDHDLFWWHLEGLTGMRFDETHRGHVGWSCSC